MPKFYRQNKKRIDPRYFLDEITDPMEDFGPQEAPDEQEVAKILKKKKYTDEEISKWINTIVSGTMGIAMVLGTPFPTAVAALTTALFYYLMNDHDKIMREREFTSLIDSWMKDPEKMFRDVPKARNSIRKKIENALGQERAKKRGAGFKFVPDEE